MENKLPKGWIETDLFDICEVITGKKDANFATENGEYSFFTCAYEPLRSDSYSFEGEVLILPGNGANVGEVFYYNGKFEAYQRTYIVQNISIVPKFLFYYFKTFWRKYGVSEQFGSATNYIKIGNFKSFSISFPPLEEQNRIVAKLDQLFAHLETAKKGLEKIPTLLKEFRQAVLTQAVTGKLTEEWRQNNIKVQWKNTFLSEIIIDKPKNGISPKAVEYKTKVKSLSLSATTSGKFDSSKIKYLDIDQPPLDSHLWLTKGDILIQRSNSLEFVGTAAIFDGEDFEFVYPDLMMKIKVIPNVSNQFIYYLLSASETRDYFKRNASGTAGNMPKINQIIVLNTPIKLPSLEEQTEIVRRVEALFAKADAIEERYKSLKEKIEQLPQAILGKAFSGEL